MNQCFTLLTLRRTIAVGILFNTFGFAQAEENAIKWSQSVILTSNYVSQGLTQSNKEPALQGSFDLSLDEWGITAGIWGSSVNFLEESAIPSERAHLELDYSVGYTQSITDSTRYELGWMLVTYPGVDSALHYNYQGVTAKFGYEYQGRHAQATVEFYPNDFGDVGYSYYYGAVAGYTWSQGLDVSLEVGQKRFDDNDKAGDDYIHYGISISLPVADFTLSVAYSGTNLKNPDGSTVEGAENQAALTISRTF